MSNVYRLGLQSVCCPSCKHYWTEDVEVLGASLHLPHNEYKQRPECDEPFTTDDFVGTMRRVS